jgi:GntR family transcriptional repressor for pyruvate dehydrogenase complex
MEQTKTPAIKEFKAIKRKNVYEEIVSQIQEQVRAGKLKPGEKLPPERKLAEIFKVSRHSVREAIRILEQNSVLKSLPGSGIYVAISDSQSIADLLVIDKEELMAIFQFRRMLEPQVARLAAENASNNNVSELNKLIMQQKEVIKREKKDVQLFIELDNKFHFKLARASKNSVVLGIIERVNDILAESRKETHQSESRMRASLKGHLEILDAIKQAKGDLAFDAMERHLRLVEKVTLDHLRSKLKATIKS